MNILAVIPARSGSKGIPGKNLKELAGKSLLARAIQTALSVPTITDIIVSTDSEEIKQQALQHGGEAPFLRPDALSSDRALSRDMWIHAWTETERQKKKNYDISVLLEPTSPFRKKEDIEGCLEILWNNGGAEAAATCSPTPGHYTPHKTLTLNNQGVIGFFLDSDASYSIRQNIPNYYHRNGLCYAVRRDTLLKHHAIIERNCVGLITHRPVVNIDEPIDLEWAEFLIKKHGDPLQA